MSTPLVIVAEQDDKSVTYLKADVYFFSRQGLIWTESYRPNSSVSPRLVWTQGLQNQHCPRSGRFTFFLRELNIATPKERNGKNRRSFMPLALLFTFKHGLFACTGFFRSIPGFLIITTRKEESYTLEIPMLCVKRRLAEGSRRGDASWEKSSGFMNNVSHKQVFVIMEYVLIKRLSLSPSSLEFNRKCKPGKWWIG